MADISKINVEGVDYSIKDETARNSIPTKTSELTNDSEFITKADIPTDESYELIGQTPLTLDETSNIKLVAEGETNYTIQTHTIGDIQNAEYNSVNSTLKENNGVYTITTIAENVSNWYEAYIIFSYAGFVIGETYSINFNLEELIQGENEGRPVAVVRAPIANTQLVSTAETAYGKITTLTFVATEETLEFRMYACHSGPFSSGIYSSRFRDFYINRGEEVKAHATPYNNSNTFEDAITLKSIPKYAVITTTPTADVYIKAPTDKTLTESDVPADAKVTGEEIEKTRNYLPLYEKTIVNFGDSIFGNAQPPNDISTFLAEKTGTTVYNCGFGGCRMTLHPTTEYAAFSMINLADAIASGDYTLQNNAVNSTEVTLNDSIKANCARLQTIDFSNVDIITIAYGSNDFKGVALDNEENLLDTTTFGGALRYSIETLLATYPNLRIFVLSAAWRFYIDENNEYTDDSNTYTNNIDLTIKDYNAKLKEVAEEYNLPYVDDYNIGIGKHNRSYYFGTTDPAHHLETGRRLIASHLATKLY